MMVSDFSDIVGDPSIGGTINYRRMVSRGTFSPSSGSIAITFSDNWINALRAPVSEKQIELSDGKYQTGDIRYMIAYANMTNPGKDDRIVDEGKEMFTVDILTDPLRIFHSVITRNLRGK